jgi:2-aminoethylphosphonate-pyruvate transaminase
MNGTNKNHRIMVDMSTTIVHNGHIRLLKKAKFLKTNKNNYIIVGLTTDCDIIKHKGYKPELSYNERKEVLEAIEFVDEVVPTPWEITEKIILKYNIDLLVHGDDNVNNVEHVKIFPRTKSISSEELRFRALSSIVEKRNFDKPMFTPGPSNLSVYNLFDIRPVFGRDDEEYNNYENVVLDNILKLTGHNHIVRLQGSATTAIDVATSNICVGNVLIVVSGYYSNRLTEIYNRKLSMLKHTSISIINYEDINKEIYNERSFDWIAAAYTETADAFLADIHFLRKLADSKSARLFLDATGSINLEEHHELAEACAFSSCKGLGGLTGAGFITYNDGCLESSSKNELPFCLDINTYVNKMTTGPYHAISSLYTISKNFNSLRNNVRKSKKYFIDKYSDNIIHEKKSQPNLCTSFYRNSITYKKGIQYGPRTAAKNTSIICHLGDAFSSDERIGNIYDDLLIE